MGHAGWKGGCQLTTQMINLMYFELHTSDPQDRVPPTSEQLRIPPAINRILTQENFKKPVLQECLLHFSLRQDVDPQCWLYPVVAARKKAELAAGAQVPTFVASASLLQPGLDELETRSSEAAAEDQGVEE